MAYFGCIKKSVSPPPEPNYLYKWDFTKSLTDEIQGVLATLGGDSAIRDEKGVSLIGLNDWVDMPVPIANGLTLEMDFGDIDTSNTNLSNYYKVIGFPADESDYGFRFYNTRNAFGVRQKGYGDRGLINVTGPDVFKNKTLKFIFTSLSDLKIYIDDVEVWSGYSFIQNGVTSRLHLGTKIGYSGTMYKMEIKTIKIYENEEA